MLDLDEVVGYASALGRKVLYSLCRRYPHEIGRALGFNSGEYLPAQYEPSGAGPFGRGNASGEPAIRQKVLKIVDDIEKTLLALEPTIKPV
jgi:hypothetical protein